MSTDQILAFLAAVAASPVAQSVALVVALWGVKVGWQSAVRWLRWKAVYDQQRAEAEVEAAKDTPDAADDKAAADALAKANSEAAILAALADAIEKHDPASALIGLVRKPGALPPGVLDLLVSLINDKGASK